MGRRPRRDAPRPPALIAVDTSVWIDHLRNRIDLPHVQRLAHAIAERRRIVVGDLVMLELLSGVPDERRAEKVEHMLRSFTVAAMIDDGSAARAARHYRTMRQAGVTIRTTVDLIIGTFCIDRGYSLLHNDRDFEPMHALLGLRRA